MAIRTFSRRRAAIGLQSYSYMNHGIVGESRPIREIHDRIQKVAGTDSTVLILGESGTGKELVTRAIHANSRRSGGPFVAVNCAAIVDTLVESELFGHEKGAFSGAIAQNKGKIEAANGGTLFLDEAGELRLQTQAALLRFLQEREFQRVGGTRTLRADVRIVAATNRNLKERVQEGQFREDLYYRLHVVQFRTPSLREIREDIPRLAGHFLQKLRYVRVVAGLSPDAQDILMRHDWPGNVRELENAIESALVLGRSSHIEPEDLPETVLQAQSAKAAPTSYYARLEQYGKTLVETALRDANGNHADAARILAISPSWMRRLAAKLNVKLL